MQTHNVAHEEFDLLRARVANLEIALHNMWGILQQVTPIEERAGLKKMMNEHFRLMIEQGASEKQIFERP